MSVTKTPPPDPRMYPIIDQRIRKTHAMTDLDWAIIARAKHNLNADYRWRKAENLLVFEIVDDARNRQAAALRFAVSIRDLVPVKARRYIRGDGFILLGFITGYNRPKGDV